MSRRDDDADWLDALAGRAADEADPLTRVEAGLLRSATRGWPADVAPSVPADVEALLAQARTDGLLRRRWCRGCTARLQALHQAWRRRPLLGMGLGLGAAVALLVIGSIVLTLPPAHDPDAAPVLRGADGVWLLRDADPAARRDRLAADLQAAGVAVTRYERLGRFGLDATLPLPMPPAVRQRLLRDGLRPADDGSLRVEVESVRP